MPFIESLRRNSLKATPEELELISQLADRPIQSSEIPFYLPAGNYDLFELEMILPNLQINPNGHTQYVQSGRVCVSVYNGIVWLQKEAWEDEL